MDKKVRTNSKTTGNACAIFQQLRILVHMEITDLITSSQVLSKNLIQNTR